MRPGSSEFGVVAPGALSDASSINLPGLGASHQRIEVNRDEAALGSPLLSVAEIQQALRALRARRPSEAARLTASKQEQIASASHGNAAAPSRTDPSGDPGPWACRPADATPTARVDGPEKRWVGVVAAHAGAGASTVALAIADAAAVAGTTAHLVETAPRGRSGLVAAADTELGIDPDGAWRRGSRRRLTVHRRATSDSPAGWPALAASEDDLVVIDLGSPVPDNLAWFPTDGWRTVVVCRPTVPGVRSAEQLLNALVTGPMIIASVGAGRWPSEVSASLGPRLRALRAGNAVVTVPTVRRLEITGLTSSPLPKSVAAAGRSLLGLIDAAHPGDLTAAAQSAPGREGTK